MMPTLADRMQREAAGFSEDESLAPLRLDDPFSSHVIPARLDTGYRAFMTTSVPQDVVVQAWAGALPPDFSCLAGLIGSVWPQDRGRFSSLADAVDCASFALRQTGVQGVHFVHWVPEDAVQAADDADDFAADSDLPLSLADLNSIYHAVFSPSALEESDYTVDPDDLPVY